MQDVETAAREGRSSARDEALTLVVRSTDLTTLEATDSPARVRALAAKAMRPDSSSSDVPPVAALCVYPKLVPTAAEALEGTNVRVASVAGGFPGGQIPVALKVAEVRWALEHGAHEVDVVIDRGAVLGGRHEEVRDELDRIRQASGDSTLKVILETSDLETYGRVRDAARLAIEAGADFVKTSTGKAARGATVEASHWILESIAEAYGETGRRIGFKAAGGIRTAEEALAYVELVTAVLGREWLTPALFRLGASSLLDGVVGELRATRLRHPPAEKSDAD